MPQGDAVPPTDSASWRARNDQPCPIIAATSTNVKAVENVLGSFAKLGHETVHERWRGYLRGIQTHPAARFVDRQFARLAQGEAERTTRRLRFPRQDSLFAQHFRRVSSFGQ